VGGRQVLRHDGGSVTVELFLVIPAAILILVASLQVVSLARARIELVGAVREGARVASTTPDPARAVDAVQAALSPAARAVTRVSVSRPSTVGSPARVTAMSKHLLGAPFPDDFGVEISATVSMLVER
jgi:Flp pilus assembly protein TadG